MPAFTDDICLLEGGGGAGVVNLKATASVKEKRALSVPVRTTVQVSGLHSVLQHQTNTIV